MLDWSAKHQAENLAPTLHPPFYAGHLQRAYMIKEKEEWARDHRSSHTSNWLILSPAHALKSLSCFPYPVQIHHSLRCYTPLQSLQSCVGHASPGSDLTSSLHKALHLFPVLVLLDELTLIHPNPWVTVQASSVPASCHPLYRAGCILFQLSSVYWWFSFFSF